MRVLFYCRIRRTKMMVQIAKVLKDMGCLTRADAFVAYRDEWRDYLRNQNDVRFEKIVGTREIFERLGSRKLDMGAVARIEREYGSLGMTLNNLINTEPYLSAHTHFRRYYHPEYSQEDILRFVQVTFEFVEELFDEIKPDAVLDFAWVNIIRCAMDLVAKRRGIPFLYPLSVRLADRFYICRRINERYQPIRDAYRELRVSRAACPKGEEYLAEFRKPSAESVYVSNLFPLPEQAETPPWTRQLADAVDGQLHEAARVGWEIHRRMKARVDPTVRYNFQLFKSLPSTRLRRAVVRAFRKAQMALKSPFRDSPLPRDYVLMTLHYQPEASTSVVSPFFVNQGAVIQMVSRAMPLHWKLLVKAHPTMVGQAAEPVSFYRWLQSMPNVQLVSPKLNAQVLIDGAKAVVAISGTSGFEAALRGKKVIVMGDALIWSMIDGVDVCTDFTRLHELLAAAEDYKPDEHALAAYLQAAHDYSFSLDRKHIWRASHDWENPDYRRAIEGLAAEIAKACDEEKRRASPGA